MVTAVTLPAPPPAPRRDARQVFVHHDAACGRAIADVVRIGTGHREGLEQNGTEQLVAMMVSAPGGEVHSAGL